jgi:hypothetical protein
MPIRSHFSNGYGKAVAILEYQGGKDDFIPDRQDYKYRACAAIDEETGKSMEYRDLLKDPKHRETWSRAAANEFGRLFNGVGKNADGTGEVQVKPSAISKIYHWDGQTLCCNPDFLCNKIGLTSEVPFFCSNFNSKRSSNSTNLLITMASLHSIAAMASFVKLNVRALL